MYPLSALVRIFDKNIHYNPTHNQNSKKMNVIMRTNKYDNDNEIENDIIIENGNQKKLEFDNEKYIHVDYLEGIFICNSANKNNVSHVNTSHVNTSHVNIKDKDNDNKISNDDLVQLMVRLQ
jgi:hypothetical protein